MVDPYDFQQLCERLWEIYTRKNHDYGDSFRTSLEQFGRMAFVIRANDKMERLKALAGAAEGKVKDESFQDTTEDLALYCIMMLLDGSDIKY